MDGKPSRSMPSYPDPVAALRFPPSLSSSVYSVRLIITQRNQYVVCHSQDVTRRYDLNHDRRRTQNIIMNTPDQNLDSLEPRCWRRGYSDTTRWYTNDGAGNISINININKTKRHRGDVSRKDREQAPWL